MGSVGIGLLGCGTVGSAVVRGLPTQVLDGVTLASVAVRTPSKPRACDLPPGVLTDDARGLVEHPDVDVVVEVMGGLEPALAVAERALDLGKPVVTANKALLGAFGPALGVQAGATGVPLLFEAAVGAGVPILRTIAGLLDGDRIVKVEGVLNGTANFIVSVMEAESATLAEALERARVLGYAEADPSRDLDGTDTADKLAILVQYAFGKPLTTDAVLRLGIDWLTLTDIAEATARGRRWRLLATAVEDCAKVEPVALRAEHPLARLTGPENGIVITAERAGQLFLAGPGAGGEPTASAVLSDIGTAVRWVRQHRVAGRRARHSPVQPRVLLRPRRCVGDLS